MPVYSLFTSVRVIVSKCKSYHVTPLLRTLNGSRLRFEAKVLTVGHKAQKDLAFHYISDFIPLYPSPFSPCPTGPLALSQTHQATPALALTGSAVWNTLPQDLPRAGSLTSFSIFSVGFPKHPNYNCKKPPSKYSFLLPCFFIPKVQLLIFHMIHWIIILPC